MWRPVRGASVAAHGLYGLMIFLLVFSPLVRGGNRHAAAMLLELLALFALVVWWRRSHEDAAHAWRRGLTREVQAVVAVIAGAAVLYLLPLPPVIWGALPGHGVYVERLRAIDPALTQAWLPASLIGSDTALSLLAVAPVLATYVAGRYFSGPQIVLMCRILLVSGVAQALLGILQLGAFKMLYFSADFGNAAIGTFANANHLANYLGMMYPLALTLAWKTRDDLRGFLYGAAALVLFAGVLCTSSRAGVFIVVLFTVFYVGLRVSGIASPRKKWGIALAALGVLALAFWFLVRGNLLGKLTLGAVAGGVVQRGEIYAATLQMAWQFFPLGAGPGTFAGVFPAFEPAGLGAVVDFAHNDYLQLLAEWGIIGVLLFAGVVIAMLVQGHRLWLGKTQPGKDDVSVGVRLAGLMGVLALALHGALEFPAHIPANAMLAGFLLGVFMRKTSAHAPQALAQGEGDDKTKGMA